jgi:hypothetical protein
MHRCMCVCVCVCTCSVHIHIHVSIYKQNYEIFGLNYFVEFNQSKPIKHLILRRQMLVSILESFAQRWPIRHACGCTVCVLLIQVK